MLPGRPGAPLLSGVPAGWPLFGEVATMVEKWRASVLGTAVALGVAAAWLFAADRPSLQERRDALTKTAQAGNYRDAYEGLRKLALDPGNDGPEVGRDLDLAITCLQQLGRSDEIDDFREAVITAHKQNWRLLEAA